MALRVRQGCTAGAARSMWEGVLRVASDGIYRWMRRLKAVVLAPENGARVYLVRGTLVAVVGTAMLLAVMLTFQATMPEANANALRVSPTASCSQLARLDPTITNGSSWGRTILPGHGAPGGWFGVDVCSNGFNSV